MTEAALNLTHDAKAEPSKEPHCDLLVRGLDLIADHFRLVSPLQKKFNVRGWPSMAATTSEAFSECAEQSAALIRSLSARVAELAGALEPFAREAGDWTDEALENEAPAGIAQWEDGVALRASFAMADLRRAAHALKGEQS